LDTPSLHSQTGTSLFLPSFADTGFPAAESRGCSRLFGQGSICSQNMFGKMWCTFCFVWAVCLCLCNIVFNVGRRVIWRKEGMFVEKADEFVEHWGWIMNIHTACSVTTGGLLLNHRPGSSVISELIWSTCYNAFSPLQSKPSPNLAALRPQYMLRISWTWPSFHCRGRELAIFASLSA
jgi:hypothetical protein